MLASRKDLTAKIAALESDLTEAEQSVADLTGQLTESQAETAQLTQDLTTEREAHDLTKADLHESSETLEAVKEELTAANTRLATFDDEVEKKAKLRSDCFLESLGHDPIPEGNGDDLPTPDLDILEQAAAIDDPTELARFHREHSAEIKKALFPA